MSNFPFGFPPAVIEACLAKFAANTPARFDTLVANLTRKLEALRGRTVHISLGTNCACAVKLREAMATSVGSSFFDNIVIDVENAARLLESGFANVLDASNLSIGSWEANDSVHDRSYEILFHHYFYPRGFEKRHESGRRRIDVHDIGLFFSDVRYKFEYLARKFALVASTPDIHKVYYLREINGKVLPRSFIDQIQTALLRLGAINYSVSVIIASHETTDYRSFCIADDAVRWGHADAWRSIIAQCERDARTCV